MDLETRQRMYQLAEGFSMHAHKTAMVLHPVMNLIDLSVDHLKQVADYTRKGLNELKKVELSISQIGLPHPNSETGAEVRANLIAAKKVEYALDQVVEALRAVEKAANSNIDSLQGAKVPLKGIIDTVDAAATK